MTHKGIFVVLFVASLASPSRADEPAAGQIEKASPVLKQLIQSHCLACHDKLTRKAGLVLEELLAADMDRNAEAWEKVVRKLSARQMPPPDSPRPTEVDFDAAILAMISSLDAVAVKSPNPGRTETFRRLNRTEYQNTIRDLLGLDVDVAALLPADESSHGFDNVTVADLSPTLLNRYISAAQKISRLAVGTTSRVPSAETVRVRPDITQDVPIDGLPIGTRGGTLIKHHFPQDGDYEIQVHLMRDRNEGVEGLSELHEMEILLDRQRVELFTVKPPARGQSDQAVDANLKSRIHASAGPHKLGVAFLKKSSSLLETTRQPLNVHFNYYRHPRLGPAIYEVSIIGPMEATGPGQTPSRRRIFISHPENPDDEQDCARRILSNLTRRAYRRPVDDADLRGPLAFYKQGRQEGGFDGGIEAALSSLLVNPQFLFRIERDPPGIKPGTPYRISQIELASRLSYFLWSSTPDDELLDLATRGTLSQPEVLEQQVRRMLADGRSRSLATNFAGQWLYLRNLEAAIPDMRLFPDFDDNLRQALRQETELFFDSILREDRDVLELIQARYTFLNERLAKHYGIPHVYGSQFRRVAVDDESHRGGLLRHGSILTVTSYATRTSPVLRGHWVLQNLVGAAPPPPPPDVPALKDNTVSSLLSIRERLQQHRADAACASCHQQMDPVGFSLENFDAVGRWREMEGGQAIDVTGGLIDGSEFKGVSGLETALLSRPELFVRTLTEKLLTYGLGRGVEYYDAPAVRQIVRDARNDDYRFSSLIVGIVKSTPFQMRNAP
ncbi:MAG: DUF1592 domain-containing protein [Planctomycetes bacterium]|nr:DUF1592 domain-containing protein [Planctomycetota bacterium]